MEDFENDDGITSTDLFSHYLYMVLVEGVPRYIGKGVGNRYKHALSGTSSCLAFNAAFFEGMNIRVYRSDELSNMSQDEATFREKRLISTFGPMLLNTHKYSGYSSSDHCDFMAATDFFILLGTEDYIEINTISEGRTEDSILQLAVVIPSVFSEMFKEDILEFYKANQLDTDRLLETVDDMKILIKPAHPCTEDD